MTHLLIGHVFRDRFCADWNDRGRRSGRCNARRTRLGMEAAERPKRTPDASEEAFALGVNQLMVRSTEKKKKKKPISLLVYIQGDM